MVDCGAEDSARDCFLRVGNGRFLSRKKSRFIGFSGPRRAGSVPASAEAVRLNRGGDRAANSALHIITIDLLRTDPRTKAYVARRIAQGHSKLEAIRCLKRYIAREVFTLISQRKREIGQVQIAT